MNNRRVRADPTSRSRGRACVGLGISASLSGEMLSPQVVPKKRPSTESTRLGGEFILLDTEGAMLRGLNSTAARVWELIDGRLRAADIAERIAGEFDAPADRVLADVLSFLALLEGKRLVELAGR